jgi:tetratricopeptide (TPR) repeat protein
MSSPKRWKLFAVVCAVLAAGTAWRVFVGAREHKYDSASSLAGATDLRPRHEIRMRMIALAITSESKKGVTPAEPAGSPNAIADAILHANQIRATIDAANAIPDLPAGHIALSNAFLSIRQNGRAVSEMETAVSLDPSSPDTVRQLGSLQYYLGNTTEAKESWAKAIDLRRQRVRNPVTDSSNPSVKEVAIYRQAVSDASPNNPGVYVDLGDALWRTGDVDGAMTEYNKAIAMEPGMVDAHLVDLQAKAPARAVTQLVQAHFGLANCLKDLGKTSDAISEYRLALSAGQVGETLLIPSDDDEHLFGLASALGLAGDARGVAQAIEMMRRATSWGLISENEEHMMEDYMSIDPDFDAVRQDPAFLAIFKEQASPNQKH